MNWQGWQSYQNWTASTAVYPDAGLGTLVARDYSCLGLIDEVGEIAGKLKKAIRGDGVSSGYDALEAFRSGEKQIALRDEIGDVLYYLARYCVEHGEALEEWIYGALPFVRTRHDPVKIALQLSKNVGDTILRTDDIYLSNSCLFLAELALWLGFTLEEVAQANQEKLNSRKERGVLKGSGDKR